MRARRGPAATKSQAHERRIGGLARRCYGSGMAGRTGDSLAPDSPLVLAGHVESGRGLHHTAHAPGSGINGWPSDLLWEEMA